MIVSKSHLSAESNLLTISRFCTALALLLMCLFSAKLLSSWLQLSIPAPLIGMALMFLLLSSNLLKPQWLAPACAPILKYMALFFIPAGVGIVQYTSLLSTHWPLLLSVLTLVPLTGLCLVGWLAKKVAFYD
ncbi:CidA/LrgA family protein [Pseudoalteromonas byunsanensis]|nr:CidA/LrgA family protein [Pseudoalteromonas byunsanensis]